MSSALTAFSSKSCLSSAKASGEAAVSFRPEISHPRTNQAYALARGPSYLAMAVNAPLQYRPEQHQPRQPSNQQQGAYTRLGCNHEQP